MRIKIETVSRVAKTKSNKDYTNIKGSDGNWYNVMGNLSGLKDKEIEFEPQPFGKSMWAQEYKVIEPPKGSPAQENHGISFWDYIDAMKMAHGVALDLEPDEDGKDRSTARAALVDTAMIALTNGKVDLPPSTEDEPESPPPDDVPF